MKAIIFYTFRELLRRPAVHAALFLVTGIALFTTANLTALTLANASADDPVNSLFLMVYSAALLLCGASVFTLLRIKADAYREDYRVLRELGMGKTGIFGVQSAELFLINTAASAVFIPLSRGYIGLYWHRMERAVSAVGGSFSEKSVPDMTGYLLIFVLLLFAVSLACAALIFLTRADFSGQAQKTFSLKKYHRNVLESDPRLSVYEKLYVRRTRRSRWTRISILLFLHLLPAVLLICALSAGRFEFSFNLFIVSHGETIPQATVDKIRDYPGVDSVDAVKTVVWVKLNDEGWQAAEEYIMGLEELASCEINRNKQNEVEVNARYGVTRGFFTRSALILYAAVLAVSAVLLWSHLSSRQGEISVLRSLGLSRFAADRMLHRDSLRITLGPGIAGAVLGGLIYIAGSFLGGANSVPWGILVAGVILYVLIQLASAAGITWIYRKHHEVIV